MRKELALFAAVALIGALFSITAQAMPAAPLKGASNADQVIQVSGGCGRHHHRDRHGHCRHD